MHINDITVSIEAKDTAEIERVYRVLAAYPHEEEIHGATAENLFEALDAVVTALANDHSVMPTETCDRANMKPGSTYADATSDFFSNQIAWRRHFQSVMGGR
jgi:hypothetical protein